MKQLKSTLIVMLVCLVFVNIIENIQSETLESLYYSNLETFKPKRSVKRKLTKVSNKKIKNPTNKRVNNSTLTNSKKGISLKKLPIGLDYLPVPGNNVYLRSINFFIRFMKSINDNRDFTTLSKKITKKCNKINIFKVLRESILNCKVITKKLNDNKPVIKVFNLGCMANILTNIQNACPVFDKNSSGKNLKKTINILTEVPKDWKKKLEMIARIFVKRISFILRVFPRHIVQRIEEIKRLKLLEEKRKKQKLNKSNKLTKTKTKSKKKKEKTLNIDDLLKGIEKKKNSKGKKNKNVQKKKIQEKDFIKKNTKADDKFVKETELNSAKSMMIASFIGQYVMKILMLV